MYVTIEGMMVSKVDGEYKGKKQVTIDVLQKKEGKKSLVVQVRVPDDGRDQPEMGQVCTYEGLVYSFGNSMMLMVD